MSKRLLAVLDTNVIVGSLLTRGANYKILEQFKQGRFDVAYNSDLLKEYGTLLARLVEQGKATSADGQIIDEIQKRGYGVRRPVGIRFPTNDPKDRHLFEVTLISGEVDYVVTADRRDVHDYAGDKTLRGAKIVTAPEFLKILNESLS